MEEHSSESESPLSQSLIEDVNNGAFSNGVDIENQQEMPNNQPETFNSIEEYLKHMKEKNADQNSGISIDNFLQGFQKDVVYEALNVEDEELYQLEQTSLRDFFAERSWNRKDIVSRLSESNLDLIIKIRLYLLITDMEERKFLDIYKLISASDFAENDNHGNSLKFRSIVYEFQVFFSLLPDSERTFKNMLLMPNIFSMDMSYIVEGENISMNEKLSSEIQQYDEFICSLVQSFSQNKYAVASSDYDGYQVIKNMYAIYLNYLIENEWIDIEDPNGNKIRECATHRLKKQGIDIDKTICDFVDLLSKNGLVSDEQKAELKSCFSGWNIRNWFSVYLHAVWECVKCWGKDLFGKSDEKISYYLDDKIKLRKLKQFNTVFSQNYLCCPDDNFCCNLYQNLYSENRKRGFVLNDILYEEAIKPAKESSWENIKDVEKENEIKNEKDENNINVMAENEKQENVIVEENSSKNEPSLENHNLNENNAEISQPKLKKFLEEKNEKDKDKDIEGDIDQQIDENKKFNPEEQSKINNDLVINDPVEQAWDLIHRFYFLPDAVFTERETGIVYEWLRYMFREPDVRDENFGVELVSEDDRNKAVAQIFEKSNRDSTKFVKTKAENDKIREFIDRVVKEELINIESKNYKLGMLVSHSGMIIDAMTNPDKPVDELSENEFKEQKKELENRICNCDEIKEICASIQNETKKPKPKPKPKLEEEEEEKENSEDEI